MGSSEEDRYTTHSSQGRYTAPTSGYSEHDRYSHTNNNHGRYTPSGHDHGDDSQSELDEWSAEAGADYEDDNKEEDSSPPEDAAQGSPEDVSVSSSSEEEHVDAPPGDGSSSSEEVQNGNANEDEVKVGGGMPQMPTKMPSPEKMNDHEDVDKLTEQINKLFNSMTQFSLNMK